MNQVLHTHACQLSRIIRESPRYRPNLPVSCMGHQISQMAGKRPIKYILETNFGRFLAFWEKKFGYLMHFFRDLIGRSLLGATFLGSKKVTLVISQISIFLGWHLCIPLEGNKQCFAKIISNEVSDYYQDLSHSNKLYQGNSGTGGGGST